MSAPVLAATALGVGLLAGAAESAAGTTTGEVSTGSSGSSTGAVGSEAGSATGSSGGSQGSSTGAAGTGATAETEAPPTAEPHYGTSATSCAVGDADPAGSLAVLGLLAFGRRRRRD